MKSKDCIVELRIKFTSSSKATHTLFLKQHVLNKKSKVEEKPILLILNLPPYFTSDCLRKFFEQCGKILNVHKQKQAGNIAESSEAASNFFSQPPVSGYHVAYITFESQDGVTNALKMAEKSEERILCCDQPVSGMRKWCLDYLTSYPDAKLMQKEVDAYMEEYDKRQEEAEKVAEASEGIPDQDGWIKVTKKGRNPGISRTEANQIKLTAKQKKKRKNADLFVYAYQIRESKREKIAELRKKFEEDKLKLKAMKDARKFRPY